MEAESNNSAHPNIGYRYQWWIPGTSEKYGDEEEFMTIGIYNQFIYVNRTTNTVIVKTSANRNYYDRFNNPYKTWSNRIISRNSSYARVVLNEL